MQTEIGKWGNSLAVRIPAADARALGLKAGARVDMRVENSQLILAAIHQEPVYTLAELLEGITPENRHPEMDWGPDVGKEILDPW
jgi:antitoxin MazE